VTVFKRTIQRYGTTPQPVTPYQKAAQVWDERIGSARVQAKNWRLAAFAGIGLSTALAGGMIWQASQSRITPYVIEIDRLGEARAVGPAEHDYTPTDPQIAWYLARFIVDVRSLSIDPVLVRRNWLEAYDFTTDRAATFLSDYARASDPFKAIGDRSVSVEVTSVVRASDTSFQVKWIEQVYRRDNLSATEHWTAILSVITRPPRSAEVLRKNPLGLYVAAIAWSRELDTTSSP
jgi:type IV secretion system protein VirB5